MVILPLFAVLALQVPAIAPDQITALLRAKDRMLLAAIAEMLVNYQQDRSGRCP